MDWARMQGGGRPPPKPCPHPPDPPAAPAMDRPQAAACRRPPAERAADRPPPPGDQHHGAGGLAHLRPIPAESPPSTGRFTPVMLEARSEARNRAAFAQSAGSIGRHSGWALAMLAWAASLPE